jgi:flagellar biosynthesis protein FlhG
MAAEDQASRLRELMRAGRTARTIAVASGKGGVGKSNVALNLSILLSAAGNRVALVDADLGLANLDVLANVAVRANLSHVIAGSHTLEQVIVDLPSGVQLVPGASGLAKLADLSEFQRAALLRSLAGLEADNDVIVVDCSAGIGPNVMNFACGADHVMVVTTPEPTAITDAYAVVKAITQRRYAGHVSLLVNLAANRHEGRMTHQRIATVARQFLGQRLFDAGYVLADQRVPEAVRKREPFVLAYPRCSASRCLAALAARLRSGESLVGAQEGFFRRVANWFA